MKHQSSQRVLVSMTVLATLWVVVYWSWGPRDVRPMVSFDDAPPGDEREVLTEPGPSQTKGEQSSIPGLRVEPPEFTLYTVLPNESLEGLAHRFYGDRTLWTVIARANPLKDVERIKAGDTLRIPTDPGNVQGVVVNREGDRVSPPATSPPEFVEYVIKSGDTLGEISLRYYGTTSNARAIYEANRETLRAIDDLRLGQTIRLPADPSGSDG